MRSSWKVAVQKTRWPTQASTIQAMRYRTIKLSSLDPETREGIYWDSRIVLGTMTEGSDGRRFLYEQRGMDVGAVGMFRLGFVPFGVSAYPAMCFAGRIVFPIFDAYDDLLALSVRPVRDDWEADQKYWNESFAKGEHLYGLNLAKYSIAKADFAIVVEGQMDVLRMYSYGLTNTVGVLGGSFTPMHVNLLLRYTQNIVFIMDGDNGGRKHGSMAKEVLETYVEIASGNKAAKRNKVRYAFVSMPEGWDPDGFLGRYGGRAMRREIESEMSTNGMRVPKRWPR